MAKIYAPNRQFTGVSASVNFINGVGETGDPHLLHWFKTHGYTIEGENEKPKDGKKGGKGKATDEAPPAPPD